MRFRKFTAVLFALLAMTLIVAATDPTPRNVLERFYINEGYNAGLWISGNVTEGFIIAAEDSPDQAMISVGTRVGQNIVITAYGNRDKDHDHAASTDPSLFVHSVKSPDTDNTEWTGLYHDQTDGYLAVGSGGFCMLAATEDLCWDAGSNAITVSTNTAVASVDWGTIDLATDALDLSEGDIANVGDIALDTITGDANADTIANGTDGSWILTGVGGSNNEDLEIDLEAAANVITLSSSTGALAVNFSSLAVQTATPAFMLHEIRFCGNGFNGSDDHFMASVPFDDTEADMVTGGAGCDGLDANTAAGADALPSVGIDMAYKLVSMVCSGKCTGASAANDAVTFTFSDDAAPVADMTCTTSIFTGDGTIVQCNVIDPTPATVAAGSLIAIQMEGVDDVCNDAGDDFECFVYVTF